MNRRQFLQGMAALVGATVAERFEWLEIPGHERHLLPPQALEPAVSRAEPLSWIEVDGRTYALLDLDLHAWYPSHTETGLAADPSFVALHRAPGMRTWTATFSVDNDDDGYLYARQGRSEPLQIRIQPTHTGFFVAGQATMLGYGWTMWHDGVQRIDVDLRGVDEWEIVRV